jgi:hypothetical protein
MAAVSRHLGKKYVSIGNDPLLSHYDGDFFYSYTSLVTFDEPDYVSSHVVRDPRDIVVSAYHYHKTCKEEWCIEFNPDFGMTYQEKLNSFQKEEGMVFEMTHYTKVVLDIMNGWNYSDPKCLELKYRELIKDPDQTFSRLFTHWGIPADQLHECIEISRKYHMTKLTGRKVGEIQIGSHMRSGLPGQWKSEFSSEHKKVFKALYPGLLVKLGFEKDDNW